ncbi:MAG: alpha/beta hydrolase [Desulfosalsimonas sp.]
MQKKDVSILDRPEILSILFHPRPEPAGGAPEGAEDIDVQAPGGTKLGCRFYTASAELPHILFFHGNGEIAADYDALGPVYREYGINFLVADYRGYGRSTGSPTVAAMLSDSHPVLDAVIDWMKQNSRTGPLWVMGRSLGSAPALELASSRSNDICGLIIESGFAGTVSLLRHLGINTEWLGIKEASVFSNADRIAGYKGPTLIIHAQNDHIIPKEHAETLYQSSPSPAREMEIVAGADHNNIMIVAGRDYFRWIMDFISRHSKYS